ncbi:AzlC family ABC transporter permease [Acinetobacter gerneri]
MNLSSFTRQSDASRPFYQGALDILPLSIAVLPWGILAGSMAVNAGLSIWQSIAMSAVVFAGAAQLVSLGLVMAGASIFTIIITVFFITSQHFIYALKFRPEVMHYPFFKRLLIGFLLTDELFAVAVTRQNKLTFAYMFGAGLCFYLAWCFFSLLGIVLAHSISDLQKLHLDFSIVAVFILLIIPMIKNRACLFGVLISMCSALIFKYFHIEAGTVLSGVLGMFCAVLFATQTSRQEQKA